MISYLSENNLTPQHISFVKKVLLAWYHDYGRHLPWRTRGTCHASPYQVWISEIMLQQTTVVTVIPYFNRFIQKWPTLVDFAHADLNDILHMWQGLGYYSRARNLYKGAQYILDHFDGNFPNTYPELLKVPGIGPYTAAAIASIAFYQPIIPVDGNVVRVFSRLMGLSDSIDALKKNLSHTITPFFDATISGDFTQALMDLGATICTPRKPKCVQCPMQQVCYAYKTNQVDLLPTQKLRKELPSRQGEVWLIVNNQGQLVIRQRPDKGLLANLWEAPSFGWDNADIMVPKDLETDSSINIGTVKHTFTHFKLTLTIKLTNVRNDFNLSPDWQWTSIHDLNNYALSTLAKKVIKHYVHQM